jgi:hypothetical protein
MNYEESIFVVFNLKTLAQSFLFRAHITDIFLKVWKEHPLRLFKFETLKFQGEHFFVSTSIASTLKLNYD